MWNASPCSAGCAKIWSGVELQQILFFLIPFQAAIAKILLLDQVELFTDHWWLFSFQLICANRVSVHVDFFQLAQFGKTCRYTGESVVREANIAEFRQLINGGRKSSQLVKAQVESVELLQKAKFAGKAGQTVVAEVKNLQIVEATNGNRDFLQLELKKNHFNYRMYRKMTATTGFWKSQNLFNVEQCLKFPPAHKLTKVVYG